MTQLARSLILILFITFIQQSAFQNTWGATPCDRLYGARPDLEKVKESISCFLQAAQAASPGSQERLSAYENAAHSNIWISNAFPATDLEATYISKGFQIIDTMVKEFPQAAETLYWRAVFVSAEVRMKDRGATVPRNTLMALGKIQTDLKASIKVNPTIHEYGANRVLGIMHTEMPSLAGGDKQYAELNLKIALEGAPKTAMNYRYYGNILRINGKKQQAREVLEKLLSMTPEELNPFSDAELLPLPDIIEEKNEAKKILERL